MAIPAFQKVRDNSVGKAMENDARQIAAAAQQYFLENGGVTAVGFSVTDTSTGLVSGPLSSFVKSISKGTSSSQSIVLDSTFTLSNPQYKGGTSAALTPTFNSEGKRE
jgi:hypothetical protein